MKKLFVSIFTVFLITPTLGAVVAPCTESELNQLNAISTANAVTTTKENGECRVTSQLACKPGYHLNPEIGKCLDLSQRNECQPENSAHVRQAEWQAFDAAGERIFATPGSVDTWKCIVTMCDSAQYAPSDDGTACIAPMTVSGRVIDQATGESIIGATVYASSDTSTGTITDTDGNFSIDDFPGDDKLVISYIGYETQTLDPDEDMGTIALAASTEVLDEVNVTASFKSTPCNETLLAAANATSGQTAMNKDGQVYCVPDPKSCVHGYKYDKQAKTCNKIECQGPRYVLNAAGDGCTDMEKEPCATPPEHAKKTHNRVDGDKLVCVVDSCERGYLPNDDEDACIPSEGDCTPQQLAELEHATAGELKRGECHATACADGYRVRRGKCVAETPEPILSKEDSEKQIAELQENADAMREKEQSIANRLLGGASIGAMGIGGMQVASALAQQSADESAEQDMSAYLATFRCDYGQGRNITGGQANVALPGANALLPLYTEYMQLTSDLKMRKEALGMTPGLESQVIMDSATMGLYDNQGTGIVNSTYTSLARALLDPTGADATEWAAQQSATAQQLQTGAIVAGAGALVGIVGNLAINHNKASAQDQTQAIQAKYEPLKKLQNNADALPASDANAKCPSDASGTYPTCVCNNKNYAYDSNRNTCVQCADGQIATNNGTECGYPSDQKTTCENLDENMITNSSGECECTNGYRLRNDAQGCYCPTGTHMITQANECMPRLDVQANTPITIASIQVPINTQTTPEVINLSASSLFELSSSKLTATAQQTIAEFAADVIAAQKNSPNYCITIVGHTDRTGSDRINNPLSEQRAQSVGQALTSAKIPSANIQTFGVGSSACDKSGNQPDCRKVEIRFIPNKCDIS